MMRLFMLLLTMMADVSSRHHGGDGDDDGRCPDHRRVIPSQCQSSGTTKRGRGKNTDAKLDKAYKKNGCKPLSLDYSIESGTFKIVGEYSNLFIRKLSKDVTQRAEMHYAGWSKVPDSIKTKVYSTLLHFFDLQRLKQEVDWHYIKIGIDQECARAFRDHKYMLHNWFEENDGIGDLAVSRETPHKDCDIENWHKLVDNVWTNEKKQKQSKANKKNRSQHKYASSHGSSSYAQQLYNLRNDSTLESDKSGPIQVWYNNHVRTNPTDPLLTEQWRLIGRMRETMRRDEPIDEDGSIDEVECLRRVLGTRRGFQTGVGRRVRTTAPDMSSSTSGRSNTPPDIDAHVNQLVSQQVSQHVTQQMTDFMNQMRAMNPGFNFPTMPMPPPLPPHDNTDEEDD